MGLTKGGMSSAMLRKACVRVCVGHSAVLGGQVFSCCCFLRADTGVNIQKMMSQPGQTPVQSQAQFPQRPVKHQNNLLSNCACVWKGLFGGTLATKPPCQKNAQ